MIILIYKFRGLLPVDIRADDSNSFDNSRRAMCDLLR